MKLPKKSALLGIAALLAAAFAVAILLWRQSAVPMAEPRRGDIVEAVYGLGTVTAAKTFQLKVGVTTTLTAVHVKEGDTVAKNQPLVAIMDGGVQRAPIAGAVTQIANKPGETLFPQMAILSITDLGDLYVSVALEQQGALRVKTGQRATLSFESLRGQRFEGAVRAIFPADGQFIVHINVPKWPEGILPGMTADVAIEAAQRKNALLIPVTAISNGKATVLRGHRRRKLDLQIGVVDGQWAEVLSAGLFEEGDKVLLRK